MPKDELILDLSTYKERTSSHVAPGLYHAVVEDIEIGESKGAKTAGAAMISVYLRVVGGEFDGCMIIEHLIDSPVTMFRMVGFCQAIGVISQNIPKKRVRVLPQTWKGRHLMIQVDDGEPYRGVVKSEVRVFVRMPSGSSSALDLEDALASGSLDSAVAAEEEEEAAGDEESLTLPVDSQTDLSDLDGITL